MSKRSGRWTVVVERDKKRMHSHLIAVWMYSLGWSSEQNALSECFCCSRYALWDPGNQQDISIHVLKVFVCSFQCIRVLISYAISILFPLPHILGLSEQYITATSLTVIINNIGAVGYPRIQAVLLHPGLQSTPIHWYISWYWVQSLS